MKKNSGCVDVLWMRKMVEITADAAMRANCVADIGKVGMYEPDESTPLVIALMFDAGDAVAALEIEAEEDVDDCC